MAWSDAVTPIVCFRKATAWPTQNAGADCFKCFYKRFAEAMDIWNGGIFANPDAVIENAADMFGEMTVDKRIDDANRKRFDQIEFLHGRRSG
jgi:hypothetical protein